MKRMIVFGVAVFFAIAGIAPLGEQPRALAGHGCSGCHGAVGCTDGNGDCAAAACEGHGRRGTSRDRCAGRTRRAGRADHARHGAGRHAAVCCEQSVTAACCGAVVQEQPAAEAGPQAGKPATEAPTVAQ